MAELEVVPSPIKIENPKRPSLPTVATSEADPSSSSCKIETMAVVGK
jgi:hypothetical protein